MKERRKAQRLDIGDGVKCVFHRCWSGMDDMCLNDISGTGIRIRSDRPFRKDDRIGFDLYFSTEKDPIRASGRVVWCKKGDQRFNYAVGVKYDKIAPLNSKNRFCLLFCETMLNLLSVKAI